jgi:3-oxoacyl-[acyl-carrier protein] reductase
MTDTPFADLFRLSDRVAVVTGAGSGIGRATAAALAEAGATVFCADVDGGGAERSAEAIRGNGNRAEAVRVDVSSEGDVDRLMSRAFDLHGHLDVVCNIAGIMSDGSVIDTEEEELDRVLAINFKGAFFGCRAAARLMTTQGSGSIVNMASAVVDIPAPGVIAYGASKAAVVQLTMTLAMELAPSGVRVNAVAPGFVRTAITERHFVLPDGSIDEERRDATLAAMVERTPLRILGEPEDVAGSVLFLASDAARFMTGQVLRPNGGTAMR